MQIRKVVNLTGPKGSKSIEVIIDTGAEITTIPKPLVDKLTDTYSDKKLNLRSLSGHMTEAKITVLKLSFPTLNNISYIGEIAVVNNENIILIGLDILNALNIHLDSKNKDIYVPNEMLEAATKGLAVVGGAAIITTFLYLLFGRKK